MFTLERCPKQMSTLVPHVRGWRLVDMHPEMYWLILMNECNGQILMSDSERFEMD
jgi:hypothetical protein